MRSFIAVAGGYLLGSIPFGLFWGWLAQRVDVRRHGSGRTGGGNVWRTAGFVPGLLTGLCDGLKGAAAIWLARALGVEGWVQAVAGSAAVLGHNYSLFLKFKGGAGTMVSVGAAAVFWPLTIPLLVIPGVLMALAVGHSSMASILVALLLPLLFGLRGEIAGLWGFALPTMGLTLWALRPNIRRLLRREERFIPIYQRRPPPILICRYPPPEIPDQ